jgi:hypothetical protein
MTNEQLPSWTNTRTRRAIVEVVERVLDLAEKQGWTVVSVKND